MPATYAASETLTTPQPVSEALSRPRAQLALDRRIGAAGLLNARNRRQRADQPFWCATRGFTDTVSARRLGVRSRTWFGAGGGSRRGQRAGAILSLTDRAVAVRTLLRQQHRRRQARSAGRHVGPACASSRADPAKPVRLPCAERLGFPARPILIGSNLAGRRSPVPRGR